MKNRKIIIDREKISQKEIKERSNFNDVLNQLEHTPNPFWKTTGFWGVTGLASLLMAFILPQTFPKEEFSPTSVAAETVKHNSSLLPEDSPCINPISAQNDIPYTNHIITAGVDTLLKLEDGSIINIQANSFLVDGAVTIKTRLFNDKSSAFLAGIPMDFGNSAFESAGMIEVQGVQNGKAIEINPEAPIQVALNAYKDPREFGFYSLNAQTGEWTDYPCELVVTNQSAEVNIADRKQELNELNKNIASVKESLESITTPTKEEYNLPKNEDLIFDLSYAKKDYPELSAMGDVRFELLTQSKQSDRLFNQTWEDVKLSKSNDKWNAQFIDGATKINVAIRPVLTGEKAKKAFTNYQYALASAEQDRELLLKKEQTLLAEQEQKQAQLNSLIEAQTNASTHFEATRYAQEEEDSENSYQKLIPIPSIKRTRKFYPDEFMGAVFSLISFGTFNIDRPVRYPTPNQFATLFEVADEGAKEPIGIYLFDLKKDVRYTYGVKGSLKKIEDFGYHNTKSVVVCAFNDGTIGIGNTKEMRKLDHQYKLLLTPMETEELTIETVQSFLNEERVSV